MGRTERGQQQWEVAAIKGCRSWGTTVEWLVEWCPTTIHARYITRLLQDTIDGEPLSTFVARQSLSLDTPCIVIDWLDCWIVGDNRQQFAQLQAEFGERGHSKPSASRLYQDTHTA